MEKNFKAINMVRKIRDKIYEEIKNMSVEEKIEYFNKQGKEAKKELGKKIKV